MNFLKNIKISSKVFTGFGVVLALLLLIAGVGFSSLDGADTNFMDYRSLARQTNQAGRIQANRLMTRLFVKNFVIEASEDNIKGVKERAQATLDLIPETRELTTDPKFLAVVDKVEGELKTYVAHFEDVTKKQARRNALVDDTLNVVGPKMEKALSDIMESAFNDGDAEAAYRAGVAMRSLLLGRLYVTRYLVTNDQESYDRVMKEMADMDKAQEVL
ncbi:MAG: Tar ligand binding domain-containing protein, partial [Alphaproteobacteria bacterium]|nr:Tar ligand binding domain-containing protein [Alphaproteobacteria bacterium]